MKYTTPRSQWIKAIALDIVFIGGYAFATYQNFKAMQLLYIVFFWLLTVLSTLGKFSILLTDTGAASFYTPDTIKRLSFSITFELYHDATDFIMIYLLANTDHIVLASLYALNHALNWLVISEARKRANN